MKKLIALLLALAALLSLAACGEKKKDSDDESSKGKTDVSGSTGVVENSNGTGDKIDDLVETLKPEGWDENNYGMYIYGKWDSEFLPDCMPAPIEGVKADQTTFKDYKHDTLSGDYSVGNIYYENHTDYREYGVSFYATTEQIDQFLEAVINKGFVGNEIGDRDNDSWWEFTFYNDEGWFMYIYVNVGQVSEPDFDGLVSVCLTDSVFKRPESVSGVALPQMGMPEYDYTKDCCIYDENYDEFEFNLATDSFPTDKFYSMFFGYYGITAQYTKEYAGELIKAGWTIVHEDDKVDTEKDYYALLEKNGQYVLIDLKPYDGILEIGFSSMIEALQY